MQEKKQRDENLVAQHFKRPSNRVPSDRAEQNYAGLRRESNEKGMEQKPAGRQIQEGPEETVKEARQEVAAARVPWYRAVKRGHILIGLYALQLLLFGLLASFVYYHPVLGIDVQITRDFQADQSPWLRDTMMAVSFIGNEQLLSTALVILAAVIFWIVRLYLEALLIVVVSATSALLNELIKLIVERPRPTANLVEVIQKAGGKSFPSGHVMAYIAFWGLLFSLGVILFKGNRWWRIALLIVPALFVVLVGPSRIYLGDHWATDVLGAYLIGGAWLWLWLWVYLKLKAKGVLAPKSRRHRPESEAAAHDRG